MTFRRSVTAAYVGQGINIVTSFAGSVVVARLLSPHELGVFALAMAINGIIQVFVAFGVASYVVSDKDLSDQSLVTAFTVNAILSVLAAALMYGLSFAGTVVLGDPGVRQVLTLAAVCPLISLFNFRALVMMQREMRFQEITAINVVSNLTSTLVTVLAALGGASYLSPIIGTMASTLFVTLAYTIIGRKFCRLQFGLTGWRPMIVFGIRMLSIGGIAQLSVRLCEIVLGRLQGTAVLGLYGRASALSNILWNNVYGSASQVVFSQMAKDLRETGELKATFLRSLQLLTAVLWPLLLGVAILAKPIVLTLYGEKWLGAAAPLTLLMLMQVVTLTYGMNWELFVLRGESARQTRIEVTRSAIGLMTFTAGAFISMTGAAVGRLVDATVGAFFYRSHVRRLAGSEVGEIRRVFLQSALLAAIAVTPATLVMLATGWSARTPLAWVIPAVALGIAGWLAGSALLKHPVHAEIKHLLRIR